MRAKGCLLTKGAADVAGESGVVNLAEKADELAKPCAQEDKLLEIDVCTDTEPEDSSAIEDESDSEDSEDSEDSYSLSDSDAPHTSTAN
eukprot:5429104-Pleurochrysis_carterae.AAC.1